MALVQQIGSFQGGKLFATRQPASVKPTLGTIVYLHGGGLIFGHRDDLPTPYIRLFNHAGFDLVAIDYPLAPGATLPDILASIEASIAELDVPSEGLVLLGRSAGAFLVHQLVARSARQGTQICSAIVSLYGYASIDDPAFRTPNAYYQSFAAVDTSVAIAAALDDATARDFAGRFSLYVGLRQQGTWADAVVGDMPIEDTVVTRNELRAFPPTFIAHAIRDPDVPFRLSKELAAAIPERAFVRYYDTDEHDFDRAPDAQHGLPIYQHIVGWLTNLERTQPEAERKE